MINTGNKGARAELLAKKLLEAAGYMVEKVRRGQWQKQDFFGCWDICAVHPRLGILWVQVSTKPVYSRGVAAKKAMLAFPIKPGVHKEYWQYTGKDPKFRIWHITNDEIKEYK